MKYVWIARNKSGQLCLYQNKPVRKDNYFIDENNIEGCLGDMPDDFLFWSEVTWKNSPRKLELKQNDNPKCNITPKFQVGQKITDGKETVIVSELLDDGTLVAYAENI